MKKTLATNSFELYQILEKKYGKRFNADPFNIMKGRIDGTIDSKKISINFNANEYLVISTEYTSKSILEELQPFLTVVMGGEMPICSYIKGKNSSSAIAAIEWDFIAPEERIKEIINGVTFSDEPKIYNLKLYNNKKSYEYIESSKEKEDRIKKARIYGIYPGSIKDVETINNLCEIDLYFTIDAMKHTLFQLMIDNLNNKISDYAISEAEYALEFLIYQTKKFGVKLEEPTIEKHVLPNRSYEAWFKYYDNHFKKVLSKEQWNEFAKAYKEGQDITPFLPYGKWNDFDLLEQPVQKILKI